MDGPSFYRKLTHRLPMLARRIVFVTGDVMDREKREWLESTGCMMLAKPFDVGDVRRAVQRISELDTCAATRDIDERLADEWTDDTHDCGRCRQ
jgi:hypothetical protein